MTTTDMLGLQMADPLAGLRIVYSYHTNPAYMAPTQLSTQQVNCGPFYQDAVDQNGKIISLATPVGAYDLAAIVARLPAEQQPDLVVIKSDATRTNMPYNIGALPCPAVLLAGDTQHLQQPLRTVVQYATSQPFAVVVTDHKRHHLHFFAESGAANCHWLPGFNLNIYPVQPPPHPAPEIAFVGQAAQFHPVRRHLLELIGKAGLPLRSGGAPQAQAAQIYAATQINFNCSLNGDLNLRVFEVLAHGGFLLTDALPAQSGLDTLFKDGVDLATYSSPADLVEKCRYYLQRPDLCAQIARQGQKTLLQHYHPRLRRQQLYTLVKGGQIDPQLRATADARVTALAEQTPAQLQQRMRIYEYAQSLNRITTEMATLLFPGTNIAVACDIADLPRLKTTLVAPTDWQQAAQADQTLRDAGVAQQLSYRSRESALDPARAWGLLILTMAELHDTALISALATARWRFLAVADLNDDPQDYTKITEILTALGAKPINEADYPVWERG